nr:NAD(P)-binding domain-containing protein [Candidatus Sigynarchaeota archaeon]
MREEQEIAIIGTGNGGRAVAAYLTQKGHKVNLYHRTLKQIKEMKTSKRIHVTVAINGYFNLINSCLLNKNFISIGRTMESVRLIENTVEY